MRVAASPSHRAPLYSLSGRSGRDSAEAPDASRLTVGSASETATTLPSLCSQPPLQRPLEEPPQRSGRCHYNLRTYGTTKVGRVCLMMPTHRLHSIACPLHYASPCFENTQALGLALLGAGLQDGRVLNVFCPGRRCAFVDVRPVEHRRWRGPMAIAPLCARVGGDDFNLTSNSSKLCPLLANRASTLSTTRRGAGQSAPAPPPAHHGQHHGEDQGVRLFLFVRALLRWRRSPALAFTVLADNPPGLRMR